MRLRLIQGSLESEETTFFSNLNVNVNNQEEIVNRIIEQNITETKLNS